MTIIGISFFFMSALLFIYSIFFLKPFTPKRKKALRFAYLLSFVALVMVLYGRGFASPLMIASFLCLFISYIAWELALHFMRR